ncbi:MAG: phosphatidate cytidylyltransferase [Candidatus Dormibacteraeota bacterium]|uniref:Phosphatidate cytidylyltransferase n=1 Tax=Candidatus Aeolococcus gillhamiae TaxID=3127015 RepID=A0A934JVA6_9BACT|nr:phosphatidate cytidylyltransferase [Candidatus Dormibacteraeota bacterium]
MAVRWISGVLLLVLVAGAVAAGGSLFVAVVAAAAAVGAWEFAGLAARLDARPPLWLLLPLTVWLAIRYAVPGSPPALDIGLGAGLVAGIVGLVATGSSWRGWMAALAGAVYVGFSLGYYVALLTWRPSDHRFGIAALAVPVAAVIVCDTAAYLVGSAFGRRPFFPQLSPRKSLEGAVAGLVGAVAIAAVLGAAYLGISPWVGAAEGLLVAVVAQAGDLAESALKRQGGAKDSSNLIPGHGGLLDRLDSIVLVAPAVYCFYRLISLA